MAGVQLNEGGGGGGGGGGERGIYHNYKRYTFLTRILHMDMHVAQRPTQGA